MPALNPLEHIRLIFETLVDGLTEYFTKRAAEAENPAAAQQSLKVHLNSKSGGKPDLQTLLQLVEYEKPQLPFARINDPNLQVYARDLRKTRNRWAHFQAVTFEEAERTADTAIMLLQAISPSRVDRVSRLKHELHIRLPVGLQQTSGHTAFWDAVHFLNPDTVNDEIWRTSPDVQRSLKPSDQLVAAGSVGAQQAMLETEDKILPWIPDLLGKQWREKDSVIVVGMAYSGIIKEYSTRAASINLSDYKRQQKAADFQQLFLEKVVQPDPSYYGYISALVGTSDASHLALLDLCRASFVCRGASVSSRREDAGPVQAIAMDPREFMRYAEHPASRRWTWSRITESRAQRILCVGKAAEHGILRLFCDHKCVIYKKNERVEFRLSADHAEDWPLHSADPAQSELRWATEGGYWRVVLPNEREWLVRPI